MEFSAIPSIKKINHFYLRHKSLSFPRLAGCLKSIKNFSEILKGVMTFLAPYTLEFLYNVLSFFNTQKLQFTLDS
jgi:hypothetical protein